MLKGVIEQVVTGHDLDRAEARSAMETIMRGEASPVQIAGLLVGMRMKCETVDGKNVLLLFCRFRFYI